MTYTQITLEERYAISALRRLKYSCAEIARELGRDPSTISREVRRNAWRTDGRTYWVDRAQSYTNERRRVSRRNTQFTAEEWAFVEDLLREDWSPEQIVGWCARFKILAISHETIYRHIHADRANGGTLYTHLRVMTKNLRKRYGTYDSRGRLAGKRHISTRPAGAENRSRFGHWEGDTVMGSSTHAKRQRSTRVSASSLTRSRGRCARSRSTTGRSSTPMRSSRRSSTPSAISPRRIIRGSGAAMRMRTG